MFVKKALSWLNAFVMIFAVTFIIVAFSYHMPDGNTIVRDYDLSAGWENTQTGKNADLLDIKKSEETVSIQRLLTANEASGASLCFQTSNLIFNVYLDDDLIYRFDPKLSRIEGKYYGDAIHYVNIPFFENTAELRIEYKALVKTNWTCFRQMKLQNARYYEYDILSKNLYKFLVSAIIIIFGVFLVMFGMVFDRDHTHRVESTSLGAFAIIMGIWTSSGSMVSQSFGDNPSFVRVLEYTALILLPVPVLTFIAAFTKSFRSKVFLAALALSLANFLFTFTAVLIGAVDYHDILFLTHGVIVIGVAAVIYLLAKNIRHSRRMPNKKLIFAFLVMFAGGIIDLVRYYAIGSQDTAKFSRMGLAVFILVFAVYELQQLFDLTRRGMELEVMEKLAHTDGLTGLYNRNALEELEERIKHEDSGQYIFIQLDINGLKAINDTYGHAAGDSHISAAAEILLESFEGQRVFRMGGDEFLVVISGDNCAEILDRGIRRFNELQKEYNETVDGDRRLEIAYGTAEYEASSHDPEEAERVADLRMYECKNKMKSAMA